jgi:hypothetical protein
MDTLQQDESTFMAFLWILLTIRNVSRNIFREYENTLYVQLHVSEKYASYEIMCKYMV